MNYLIFCHAREFPLSDSLFPFELINDSCQQMSLVLSLLQMSSSSYHIALSFFFFFFNKSYYYFGEGLSKKNRLQLKTFTATVHKTCNFRIPLISLQQLLPSPVHSPMKPSPCFTEEHLCMPWEPDPLGKQGVQRQLSKDLGPSITAALQQAAPPCFPGLLCSGMKISMLGKMKSA